MNFKVTETLLPGVLIIDPVVHGDSRGFFLETWREDHYHNLGIDARFVQDNHSRSVKDVLRGMHLQTENPQGKLVRVARGAVYDVAVDINPASLSFGRWVGVEINDENHRLFYVPAGYAHGFCVLSEIADFLYRCTDYYRPGAESGVRWDDPDLAITWPVTSPMLSAKDRALPLLRDIKQRNPR